MSPPKGTAANRPRFPTLLEAFNENRTDPTSFVFELTSLRVEHTDPQRGTYKAHFWVTSDALKYRITQKRPLLYAEWTKDAVPDIYDPATPQEMLCRLPCSAKENQDIADAITTHPDADAAGAVIGLINHDDKVERPANMRPEGSLLLTPRLFDLRYAAAKMKVFVHPQDINKPTIGESKKLHQELNAEMAQRHAASNATALPNIVADAGKIWAIHNSMYVAKTDAGAPSAINYGWHLDPSDPKKSLASKTGPVSQPDKSKPVGIVQAVGTKHDAGHFDYSQLGYLIAGWCQIVEPGATKPKWYRTEEVYRTAPLCNLVTHDGKPLTRTRY